MNEFRQDSFFGMDNKAEPPLRLAAIRHTLYQMIELGYFNQLHVQVKISGCCFTERLDSVVNYISFIHIRLHFRYTIRRNGGVETGEAKPSC